LACRGVALAETGGLAAAA